MFDTRRNLNITCDFCRKAEPTVQYEGSEPSMPPHWITISGNHYCYECARVIALARIATHLPPVSEDAERKIATASLGFFQLLEKLGVVAKEGETPTWNGESFTCPTSGS